MAAGWTAQARTGSGTYGTFTVNANGTYSYTLTQRTQDGAGVETDSFSYTAKDANGNSVINTVTITIVDDVPVAAVDTGSVTEGALLTKTAAQGVLSNDKSGADGWESTGAVVGVVKGSNTSVDTQTGVNTAIPGSVRHVDAASGRQLHLQSQRRCHHEQCCRTSSRTPSRMLMVI